MSYMSPFVNSCRQVPVCIIWLPKNVKFKNTVPEKNVTRIKNFWSAPDIPDLAQTFSLKNVENTSAVIF